MSILWRLMNLALVLQFVCVDGWMSNRILTATQNSAAIARSLPVVMRYTREFPARHRLNALPSKAQVASVLEQFDPVIGVEAHVQLNTQRKAFCYCPANYQNSAPNTNICPICIAEPGTLPVPNPKMVELGAQLAMALNCTLSDYVTFDRKHYFYPDTPKNYQITQHANPIGSEGSITLPSGSVIGISRIQMEEDSAKIVHGVSKNMVNSEYALLDFNRAGVALLEIVSEPDIQNADKAVEFGKEVQAICRFLNISNGNMQEGSLRLDVNLSLRPKHRGQAGGRVEMKNLNSFRSMHRSIEYELVRQAHLLAAGDSVREETKMWDEFALKAQPLRIKYGASGYRMSIEPNIPPIVIMEHLPTWKSQLAELPAHKRQRYQTVFGLDAEHTRLLTRDPASAAYFEETVAANASAIETAKWIVGEVEGQLKAMNMHIADMKLSPTGLAHLINFVRDGVVTIRTAKQSVPLLMKTGEDIQKYIEAHNCTTISDRAEIRDMINDALHGEADKAAQFRTGPTRLLGYFVGKVMKRANGRADPHIVQDVLKEMLG